MAFQTFGNASIMLALAWELVIYLTAQAQKPWLMLKKFLTVREAAQRSKGGSKGREVWSWKNEYQVPKNGKSTINERVLLTIGGVAATEDISDGAWPDTELASYILQIVGPTELNSYEGKCTLNPQKWLSKNCILKQ